MRKKSVVIIALVVGVVSIGLYAMAQQRTVTLEGQKLHILPATLETTQWGWLDPKEPSKLTMKSGELVAIETMMHAHNQINPGTTMEEIVKLRLANPGGGPHSVTGPVYVEGAEPGGAKEKTAPVSTLRPWKNASNLDLNELQEGSILYVPVLLKGGLVWVGDAHCRQGDNEGNLTAIECAFREIHPQPIVRNYMKLTCPRAETATHWTLMGFHED